MIPIKKFVIPTIGLLALLALANIAGLFFPKTVMATAERSVKGAQTTVFDYIATPRLFTTWMPWRKSDPSIQVTFVGPGSGMNAGFTWTGNATVGSGTWRILRTNGIKDVYALIESDDMGTIHTHFSVRQRNSAAVVRWTMEKDMGPIPMFRMFGPMISQYFHYDLAIGLQTLDSILSSQPSGRVESVERTLLPDIRVLAVASSTVASEMGQTMAKSFGAIIHYAMNNHIVLNESQPLIVEHRNRSKQHAGSSYREVLCAIQCNSKVQPTPPVILHTIKGGDFITAKYYGNYDQSAMVHDSIRAYARRHRLTVSESPMEWYVTNPRTTPDTSLWRTDVYYRVTSP